MQSSTLLAMLQVLVNPKEKKNLMRTEREMTSFPVFHEIIQSIDMDEFTS